MTAVTAISDPFAPVPREHYAPALDADAIAVRDRFVEEYLKDYEPVNACLRCGFAMAFAVQWAPFFMTDTYVQRRIIELTRAPQLSAADQDLHDRALLENTLREAMQKGHYATRVSAAKAFGELKGWSKHNNDDAAAAELIEALKGFAVKAPA
jgi:hypothetical protein